MRRIGAYEDGPTNNMTGVIMYTKLDVEVVLVACDSHILTIFSSCSKSLSSMFRGQQLNRC